MPKRALQKPRSTHQTIARPQSILSDYENELIYQLDLVRADINYSAPREAAGLLWKLSGSMVAGEMKALEVEKDKALLSLIASELKNSSQQLERFRWANFDQHLEGRPELTNATRWSRYKAEVEIIRSTCPFLESYLLVQLSELKKRIHAMQDKLEQVQASDIRENAR